MEPLLHWLERSGRRTLFLPRYLAIFSTSTHRGASIRKRQGAVRWREAVLSRLTVACPRNEQVQCRNSNVCVSNCARQCCGIGIEFGVTRWEESTCSVHSCADDGTALYSSLHRQLNQRMLYNALDDRWVQLLCCFCAAIQCAIIDNGGPRQRTYNPSECQNSPKIPLVHDERRSGTPVQ